MLFRALQSPLSSPVRLAVQSSLQRPTTNGAPFQTSVRAAADLVTSNMGARSVQKVVKGQKQMEGAGVRICRTIGTAALRNLDPFLMLDELKMPPGEATAGFPDHPHRGFETCSIMLSGKMEHRDHVGNAGVIGPGGVQWMTAGRGIIHSEMPVVTNDKLLHGFQLWINLPAAKKMMKPQYQDYQAKDIPVVEADGASIRVMAGSRGGKVGPIKMRNPGMLMDVTLQPGASWNEEVPEAWNGFCYVYEGSGVIGGVHAQIEHNYVLGQGSNIAAHATKDAPLKFLLVAGQPIGEPIVQHGPFVMNTQAEISQAFEDYRSGKLQNPRDDVWAFESE